MACPDEEVLLAYVDGLLAPERREAIEDHIDGCGGCALLVAEAARDPTRASEGGVDPEVAEVDVPFVPPARIGRYVVEEALGAGAMGYVFAAFDPELDRRVALKFLRPGRSEGDRGRERLIREARAIARLSHPNVVKVFEVVEAQVPGGTIVCIVMELVKGESLRHWLQTKPPLSALFLAFEQAASGLAAAHEAGIVHRDFKPENVIVVDGPGKLEVKVMDFGLARARSLESVLHAWSEPLSDVDGTRSEDASALGDTAARFEDLTAAGTILGTPRYMAPEQHRGEEADPRSDQFAFCVAFYEALFEQRAFSARDYEALGRQKNRPRSGPLPRRRGVPTSVAAAVCKGLSPSRDDRFADMRSLIAEIERARAPRRRAPWVWGGLLVALGLGGLRTLRQPSTSCSADAERVRSIWNAEVGQAVEEAFAEIGVSYGPDALLGVRDGLDAYARGWTNTRLAICDGARADGERLLLDQQLACLDRQLPELTAVLELLLAPDVGTVKHALPLVQALPHPELCADPAFVSATVAPPDRDEVAIAVLELRGRLARIVAHGRAGRAQHVLDDALQAVEDAQQLAYLPIRAEAERVLGSLLSGVGRIEEASVRLANAFWSATEANDHAIAAQAATALIYVHGHQRAQLEEGRRWARFAETALRRVQADPAAWARYEYNFGLVLSDSGEYPEALDLFERALDRYAEAGPGHEVAMATTLNGLAGTRARAGDLRAARAELERVVASWEAIVGPEHPDTALAYNNLGTVSIDLGDYDRAERELERALQIAMKSLGPDHVSVGDVLLNRGRLHARTNRPAEARRDYLRAIEIWTPRLPADHPSLAQAYNNLGVVALGEGDAEGALVRFDAALEAWENALGADHPRLVMALENRAEALSVLGRPDEAARSLERAVEVLDASAVGEEAASDRDRLVAALRQVRAGRRLVDP